MNCLVSNRNDVLIEKSGGEFRIRGKMQEGEENLAGLEQDIIGPVYRLTRERTPKVAIFGPKKEIDQQTAMMYLQQGMQPPAPQEQFGRITELLGQGHYEAVAVDLTEASPIPEDADCLVVMAMSSPTVASFTLPPMWPGAEGRPAGRYCRCVRGRQHRAAIRWSGRRPRDRRDTGTHLCRRGRS